VLELCRTSWADAQIAPARCERLGDGDGLGDLEVDRLGDGLGEVDFGGLGLLLADAVALLLGLVEVGLPDGLVLHVPTVGVGLAVGVLLCPALTFADWRMIGADEAIVRTTSRLADSAAVEARPQGELIGRADEATAGAIEKPDARKNPAARQTATRPARTIPTGTALLPSPDRRSPVRPPERPCTRA
jgi:hypothetical protein